LSVKINTQSYNYVILYLIPEELIQKNKILQLQWENIRTLIPCLLKSLYSGNIEVKLHELDKIFTGITKLKDVPKSNILGKVASLWYYLTKIFHQSLGPRIGSFTEELLKYWIDSGGIYEVIGQNITLEKALKILANINIKSRARLDFVLKSTNRAVIVELRMSEHTGGRTAQESLLDKIVQILKLLENHANLRQNLINKKIYEIEFAIGILFNENHELLTKENVNIGRLTSLISYIMEERHVWGALKELSNKYKMCDSSEITFDKIKDELSNLNSRKICLYEPSTNFKIWLKILFGDEFLKEFIGLSLGELLLKYGSIIADDVWLFYTVLINELKIAKQFGYTNVRKIYEDLKTSEIPRFFINLYNAKLSLNDYLQQLNQLIENSANTVIRIYERKGQSLRLLETNDIVASFEYLKQLCICALALYLTIDHKRDSEFKECRWE
jgi:hypothetical protein